MKIVKIDAAIKRRKKISQEIYYTSCFASKHFTSGLIVFRPVKISDKKQIEHIDKDVVCHVIRGTGRVHIKSRRIQLRPGMLCHIPKNIPHDFAAGKTGELLLFYSLVDS
jgi:mannose-6-phosphate isomerase-like protein (cupin superfamily)